MVRLFMKDPNTEGPLLALFAATSLDFIEEKITGSYVGFPPPAISVFDPRGMENR